MTTWNYRVLVFKHNGETAMRICEVYYTDGKPDSYGISSGIESCNGKAGLSWTLRKCKEALNKPFLYGGEKFPKVYKPKTKRSVKKKVKK